MALRVCSGVRKAVSRTPYGGVPGSAYLGRSWHHADIIELDFDL